MSAQTLEKRADIPEPSMGAPLPFVLGDERRLSLCYNQTQASYYTGRKITATDVEGVPDKVAVLRFTGVQTSYLGGLSETSQYCHSLADLGLTSFYAWEVSGSELVRYQNRKDLMLRHIIVLFHDSMFEVVCEDFTVKEVESEYVDDVVSAELDFYCQPRST